MWTYDELGVQQCWSQVDILGVPRGACYFRDRVGARRALADG